MKTLSWTNPTTNTDGSAYNAATENKGYELSYDSDSAAVSLPFAFGTSFDMSVLDQYNALKAGTHIVHLAVVNKDSMKSAPASTSFRIVGTPSPVTDLAVA